jgi:DNA-binding winged helix-turn-helix (wHTH) protein
MSSDGTIAFGPFRLLPAKRLLLRDGETVALTPKSFDSLVLLIERRDRVVSRRELLDALWADASVEQATLSQHVFMLRRALGGADGEYIATVHRRGYRFGAGVKVINTADESTRVAKFSLRPADTSGVPQPGMFTSWWRWAAVVLVGGICAFVLTRAGRQMPTAPAIVRLALLLPQEQHLSRLGRGAPAVSPDGAFVVYAANRQLYARTLNATSPRPISGTNSDAAAPFFFSRRRVARILVCSGFDAQASACQRGERRDNCPCVQSAWRKLARRSDRLR